MTVALLVNIAATQSDQHSFMAKCGSVNEARAHVSVCTMIELYITQSAVRAALNIQPKECLSLSLCVLVVNLHSLFYGSFWLRPTAALKLALSM